MTRKLIRMPAAETVYIIDDDASLRDALESLLKTVGLDARSYESPTAFLKGTHHDLAGCLVLDIRLPGTNGLDFQDRLANHGIVLPVVFMSGHGDVPMSVRGMRSGAIDFLLKPFRDQDMLDAIDRAFLRDRARRAAEADRVGLMQRFQSLTVRERQVVDLVVQGNMNKQVAAELSLSEITVKIHRGTAMRKMQVKTLPDLVRMTEALRLAAPDVKT